MGNIIYLHEYLLFIFTLFFHFELLLQQSAPCGHNIHQQDDTLVLFTFVKSHQDRMTEMENDSS